MANAVGTFLAHWIVGTGAAGAPTLDIEAMVTVAPTHRIVGRAHLTQATHPALDWEFDVVGTYHDAPIPGGIRHFVVLQSPPTSLVGAPHIHILMELTEDWKKGTATYSYIIGSSFKEIRGVPVKSAS